MSFHTESISQVRLDSLQDVNDWVSDTQKSLIRIPVEDVLGYGATFRDDEYLGDGETLLHFNQSGFEAICQKVGCRQDFLQRLETPTLTSHVLNDLLSQRDVRKMLSSDEFVMDERTNTIIGLVSKTYITYKNEDLLTDIEKRISQMPEAERLNFQEAYGINTALTVRFVSEKLHGTIEGRGGNGDDKSKLGLQFANSMVGNSSVRINYYLHRLICANGMTVTASESINRIFHSGHRESFDQRLDRSFNEVMRNIGQLQGMLKIVGNIQFKPEGLSADRILSNSIFDVIPGSKQELCDKENISLRYPQSSTAAEREKMRQEHDAFLIAEIPMHFGESASNFVFGPFFRNNATVFDFINVFTEHAKTLQPSKKLDVEEKAGALAKYIASNAKKF